MHCVLLGVNDFLFFNLFVFPLLLQWQLIDDNWIKFFTYQGTYLVVQNIKSEQQTAKRAPLHD
jgi:hypothetical protein